MLSDEWLSRYGLLENFNASVTRTRTGTGTWTTGVTAIALCTSCSRAKNQQSAYAKTKAQISFAVISFAVTAKLIISFVFATRLVQFLYFLNPKFPASSHLLCLYSFICVGSVQKPHCLFSHEAAQIIRQLQPNLFTEIPSPVTDL